MSESQEDLIYDWNEVERPAARPRVTLDDETWQRGTSLMPDRKLHHLLPEPT